MPGGTPIQRHWVVVLYNGIVAVDWGDGLFQDVYSGDFMHLAESQVGHTAQDLELENLLRCGQVERFDEHQVWFSSLPDRPVHLLD